MQYGKPEILKIVEDNQFIFSVLEMGDSNEEVIKFFDNKFSRIWEEGILITANTFKWNNLVYKTPQGFYLNLFYLDNSFYSRYILNIYFKSEQLNELKFFVNQINKELKIK